jgi:TolA-binding protein
VLDESVRLLDAKPASPHRAEVYFCRGRALASQALPRFEEARQAFQSSIDALPGSDVAARSQFMRGETYMHQKNYAEALREFQQVELLYQAPKWQATALLEAGKAQEALGRAQQAATSYRKLLDTYPDDPHAAEAKRRLAALGF